MGLFAASDADARGGSPHARLLWRAYNHDMRYMPVSLLIIGTLLCCASPVRADEASKLQKAGELLQLTSGDQMMKAMEPMMKAMMSQTDKGMSADQREKAGEIQRKMLALVTEALNKAKPALSKAYTDIYTEDELDAILAFYRSPAGKAFIQKMPEVMQRSTPIMMQMMTDMQSQMQAMVQEMTKSK